ncbi:MAG: hypothetical protein A2268_02935 [Candidatus Raymondbacteria bacterium RifOxyA12_full_50_37]|uniref:Transglycosylase SLT domain-containing protein n=1 Tax=Candidatus Raymondbacteria bacterium RIFOXYD12_FULL_49_13 TaxID=1817890 RepID=A0A1F7F8W8_UNCRA|nr:MAG: hypothetical protein A2248_17040 [Candidatus Raymondbacteria bacterium RIFOXYA2_FULL_49_16]OGJ90733.1 MAG: hypothetical protein A2268_02935 [Candidatus Raymondbacteria bacterium RifOxyA12_full_50_37]OGJ91710.1 MAG: hypothetical protein A2350_00345 [Candidatus Raymondbacteria bacterium RifOxyB12_full_50_8]OGJ98370.1 MAG: hypothetical protein A2453_08945 [Candidatus Raymondbacteria bacterium RIFOXYC2_FULL_50_21]OGK03095.1 MAG: hypothetical protein A2519_06775 [Candidatus Raymondbacteria b
MAVIRLHGFCLFPVFICIAVSLFLFSCEKKDETPPGLPDQADSVRLSLDNSPDSAVSSSLSDEIFALMGPGKISRYDPIVKKHSRRYGFDWRLISAQIFAESGFEERAMSRCGAKGLMQIMPKTASWLGTNPSALMRPGDNIALGIHYDHKLFMKWEEIKGRDRYAFMFASYNAGPTAVRKAHGKAGCGNVWTCVQPNLPGETRHYVKKIMKMYDSYKKKIPG